MTKILALHVWIMDQQVAPAEVEMKVQCDEGSSIHQQARRLCLIDYVTGCFADVIEKVVAVAWKSVDEAVGGVKKSEDFGDQPTQSGYSVTDEPWRETHQQGCLMPVMTHQSYPYSDAMPKK